MTQQRGCLRILIGLPFFCFDDAVLIECLEEIINHPEGLSVEHIEQIDLRSSTFIIPAVQLKAKPHAMVLTNLKDRSGAEEETEALVHSLESVGMTCFNKTWPDFDELIRLLETRITKINDECCMLVVCVLAHGFGGKIQGSYEGSHGQVNKVFDIVHRQLRHFVPVVSFIFIIPSISFIIHLHYITFIPT